MEIFILIVEYPVYFALPRSQKWVLNLRSDEQGCGIPVQEVRVVFISFREVHFRNQKERKG